MGRRWYRYMGRHGVSRVAQREGSRDLRNFLGTSLCSTHATGALVFQFLERLYGAGVGGFGVLDDARGSTDCIFDDSRYFAAWTSRLLAAHFLVDCCHLDV